MILLFACSFVVSIDRNVQIWLNILWHCDGLCSAHFALWSFSNAIKSQPLYYYHFAEWMNIRRGTLADIVTFHWLMMHRTKISIACEQQINSNIGNIYQIIYGLHTKRRSKSCTTLWLIFSIAFSFSLSQHIVVQLSFSIHYSHQHYCGTMQFSSFHSIPKINASLYSTNDNQPLSLVPSLHCLSSGHQR